MLRYSLLLGLVLSSATPVRAGGGTWAQHLFEDVQKGWWRQVQGLSGGETWPQRLFEDGVEWNFGSVPKGQMLVHYFRIHNTTTTTIHISGTKESCGLCTRAEVLNRSLAPGHETYVKAQLDSRVFDGPKDVTIDVFFDAPNRDTVRLRLYAVSHSNLFFSPDHLNFAKIEKGTTHTKEMTITFYVNPQLNGNPPFEITDTKCSSSYIQLAKQELRRDANGVIYQLSATVQPDIPVGSWYTDIWLTTNQPSMPKLRVPLSVEVEPKLIVFSPIKAGAKTTHKVSLDSKQPFRIINVIGADQELMVSPESNASQIRHELMLTFQSNQIGPFQRLIRVTTDMMNNTELEFKVQTQIIP